jgi:hypothetical protein
MTRPRTWGGRFALLLLPIGVLPLLFAGQTLTRRITRPGTVTPPARITSPQVHDWTNRHAIYSRTGTARALELARRDPRALASWSEFDRGVAQRRLNSFAARFRIGTRRFPQRVAPPIQRDWAISLGTGGTAETMFPAKFSFDINATPSCTSDFVVFPVNANSSGSQPNIVAFNQLYSGTSGVNGICNRAATGSDTGVAAEVFWSYRVSSVGGAVTTSPTISFDSTGAKIAFVESATGKPAQFHVLAWKANDGRKTSNLQDVTSPATPTLVTASPVAGSGTFTDLALGATGTDTLSSPFVDYVNDVAYVGNDAGVLFRIKNVFCTLPSCAGAQPTLDLSFNTSGSVTVCSGKALTGPILNPVNSTVYVGCADGKLYAVTTTGTITSSSISIGDGTSKTYGGVVDPPIVDSVNGFVYAVSGSAGGATNGVLVQAKADLSSNVAVAIGRGNQCDLHSPTPNNAYFNSITSAGAMMYMGGVSAGTVPQPCSGSSNGGGAAVALYGLTFNNSTGVVKSPVTNTLALGPGPGYEFAPMTEFFNATTGNDWLFYSAIQSAQTNVASSEITTGFPTTFNAVTEGIGTSGIIVDNNASSTTFPQAASIYFNALHENPACTNSTVTTDAGGCAVKLTQSGLN